MTGGVVSRHDKTTLRELAQKYLEICRAPDQETARARWREHNCLAPGQPLIYVRAFAWGEMPAARCACTDPGLHPYEDFFRREIFRRGFRDDYVFEPWVTVRAVFRRAGWGVSGEHRHSGVPGGSFKIDYPLKEEADLEKLRAPGHEIDEAETARQAARLDEALGGAITVNIDRSPACLNFAGDLSTELGYLRGIENFMLDMLDRPAWLHRLVGFLAEGVLAAHRAAEAAGDWGLCAHNNQAMPYARELPDPAPNADGVPQARLWGYLAAQEFTGVSPAMHEEFLLRYQLPILRRFGLTAYGCCENLTRKIDMLRQVPNLRRIAVAPCADVAACAGQIGRDYVLSYRPSPADMVGYGFDPDRAAGILRRDLAACRHNLVDITLKDVQTVQGDPGRIRAWVGIARRVAGEIFG